MGSSIKTCVQKETESKTNNLQCVENTGWGEQDKAVSAQMHTNPSNSFSYAHVSNK